MDLKPGVPDRVAGIARAVLGAAPYVGPLLSEVVTELIPNQRIDRLAEFVGILNAKVEAVDRARLESQFRDPEFVDLLEDGFLHVARAISRERKEYIASLIANSLSSETLKHCQYKQLLSILRELSDPEVILLHFYSKVGSDDHNELMARHAEIIQGPMLSMGSSPEAFDLLALHEMHKANLQRLGLIRPHFRSPSRRGEPPEFDSKTGMMSVSHTDITPLGRLLLRSIMLVDATQQNAVTDL
jgi:hypothetical protein